MFRNENSRITDLGYTKITNSKEVINRLVTSLELENKSPFLWEDLYEFVEILDFYHENELVNLLMNIKSINLYLFPEITVPMGENASCFTVGNRNDTEVFILSDKSKFINDLDHFFVDDYYIFDDSFSWIIAVSHEEQDELGHKVIYLKK
ncbi:hypothetical protein [Peribacillus acanthi]|uniref:hypothetical protein n=1 Tax=Peribacillus acanthi TaxID=2171554 RepID=UPI000D3E2B14|nr:hypothetical protein [Peribacillus acanthi]